MRVSGVRLGTIHQGGHLAPVAPMRVGEPSGGVAASIRAGASNSAVTCIAGDELVGLNGSTNFHRKFMLARSRAVHKSTEPAG